MKKLLAVLLLFTSLAVIFASSAEASGLGSGVSAVADEVKVIKSGLVGKKLTFSDTDFKQALCITDFNKIVITSLPDSTEGTLMLAGRRVKEGATIKRKNLASMVFIPADKNVTESKFKFTIDEYAGGAEIEFVIKLTDKVNYAPEMITEYESSLSVLTQREIGIYGKLTAKDKENDALEYIIVSYPKNGNLSLIDKTSGEYLYTPHDSYTGKDSFRFVIRDEYGNFSNLETVSITVTERMSEIQYEDMKDRKEYNASVVMTAMGIMSGNIVGDSVYFNPDYTVTKAEFVAMAMKALGIKKDTTLKESYFDDNSSIPAPLVSYVATAQRIGAVYGEFVNGELLFNPNEAISRFEAASILARLTSCEAEENSESTFEQTGVPVWGRDYVSSLVSSGVIELDGEVFNGETELTRAEFAEWMYRLLK